MSWEQREQRIGAQEWGRQREIVRRGENMSWKHNEHRHAHEVWCAFLTSNLMECNVKGWDEGGMQKLSKKWRGGGGGETLWLRYDITLQTQHQSMWQVHESGCGEQLCWPTSRWAVWVVAVLHICRFGPQTLRKCKPKYIPAKGKIGCPHSRVWFFSSSQHGCSCQRNLSSLSPWGLLLESSSWGLRPSPQVLQQSKEK